MSDDPEYGRRFTWHKGDLVFQKQGQGEPMSQEDLDEILSRRGPPGPASDRAPPKPQAKRRRSPFRVFFHRHPK